MRSIAKRRLNLWAAHEAERARLPLPAWCEYLETINCQPPRVSALRAPSPVAAGSGETSINPGDLELPESWLADHAYGQLRMKAALPAIQTLSGVGLLKVVTSCGAIVPTQTGRHVERGDGLRIVYAHSAVRLDDRTAAIGDTAIRGRCRSALRRRCLGRRTQRSFVWAARSPS